jgi:small-conductance mechanosensitive channel
VYAQSVEQLLPFAIFGVGLAVAFVVRHILLKLLYRKVTGHLTFAFVVRDAIRIPSILWCIVAALEVALIYAPLSSRQKVVSEKLIVGFLIVSVTLVVASVLVRMVGVFGARRNLPFVDAGLSRALVRVVIWVIGALTLLRHFGIPITPLLATLGVGGLAVALALQDTLANFFAGIHILVENPISLGDFIKLSTGEEGIVNDIGWRTTRVRSGANNIIVIPNTKITSGILTNFNLPEPRTNADVMILVALHADAEQVARIAMEVATSTEGVLEEPAPVLLFDPGVTPANMQFKLIFHVASQLSRGGVQSAVRVNLLKRFREENVPLPEPAQYLIVQP